MEGRAEASKELTENLGTNIEKEVVSDGAIQHRDFASTILSELPHKSYQEMYSDKPNASTVSSIPCNITGNTGSLQAADLFLFCSSTMFSACIYQ